MDNTIVKNSNFLSLREMFNLEKNFNIIAGPCAVESVSQMEQIAEVLVKNQIKILRGGAYKPRSSPYDFQGLGIEALKILNHIKNKYNLIIVSEIMDPRDIDICLEYIDVIQIGSRNMQNYSLLKEIGKISKPILLKRGMMSTVSEFLLAAEYILLGGNSKVIACERGIRTFENSTRNTLDISCIAIIKNETKLPIIADLSHSLGRTDIIPLVFKAVKAMDIDGVMIEVHPNPPNAKSDSTQQMALDEFQLLINKVNTMES